MTPKILAKITGIVAKGGERVIVIDPASGAPLVLMSLEEYEKRLPPAFGTAPQGAPAQLTQKEPSGMIDPDAAVWQEAKRTAVGDWGGDEKEEEEDRYYMEPTE